MSDILKGSNVFKLYAGIVTYNPNEEKLQKNIDSIINQVDKVIIIDNGSNNSNEIAKWITSSKVVIFKNQNNLGIARALNQICDYGIKHHYDWGITLDQDSISPSDLISKLKKYIASDVAVIGPNIIYKNNENFADFTTQGIREVPWIITSASLTNLQAWQAIGGFDERLFIDGVDRDFCIRASRKGYKILKCFDVTLLHELGNLNCRKILGKIIYVTNHSPQRKYYMTRNAIYLDKKLRLNTSKKYIVKILLKVVFFEKNKLKNIEFIYKGIRDSFNI